jgi:DNA adenine methylase
VFVPQPFPYQGSKRRLAPGIVACLPERVSRLIEPFAGSAAVSIAAAGRRRASGFLLNDCNAALMLLWERILSAPDELVRGYEDLWRAQEGRERAFYDEVRDHFNATRRSEALLYLLARCAKAAVRYNAQGEFNQSPDNRRKGARPSTMRLHIEHTAALLSGRTELSATDYGEVLARAQPTDVVYMDPPYQGVCGSRDPRYIEGVRFAPFVEALDDLSRRGVPFIVSYDGRTGERSFGEPLPAELGLTRIEVHAGRSSQATLLGREDDTYESLYLSPGLRPPAGCPRAARRDDAQLALFGGR